MASAAPVQDTLGDNSATTMTTVNHTLRAEQGAWPMVERAFHLPHAAAQPWEADVWAVVRMPDGREVNIPAYFDGGDVWKIRFTPVVRGRHAVVRLIIDGHVMDDPAQAAADGAPMEFEPQGEPADPGFLRPSPHRTQQFVFDDGTPYYPFGQNCGWLLWDDFEPRFAKMSEAGLNWSRVWMCHWSHQNLDWRVGHAIEPGALDLEVARAWDRIITAAERHNIRLQVVLQHHGQYSTFVNANWHQHPWNAANGGWLKEPQEFFTDARAREITRRKYRYIAARWGYSPAVMAWELFNEVQFTDAYVAPDMIDLWKTWQTAGMKVTPEILKKAADILVRLNSSEQTAGVAEKISLVELPQILKGLEYGWIPYATLGTNEQVIAAWHAEMARHIRGADPWRHMVTTSSIPAGSPIWAEMDFYQYHTYRPDMIEAVRQFDQPVAEFDRPIFYGEIGHHEIPDPAREDGRYMRTMLWASLFAGGAGAAQMWDWIATEKINFFGTYRALSRFIDAAELGWLEYSPDAPAMAALSGATSSSLTLLSLAAPQRTILWIYDPAAIHADEPASHTASLVLSGQDTIAVRVKWFDTRTGQVINSSTVSSLSLDRVIQSPAFRGDVAAIVEPVHTSIPQAESDLENTLNTAGATSHESHASH